MIAPTDIFPGRIAVLGSGSWATALAKLLLENCDMITWYLRSDERIAEFVAARHNPSYLTDLVFDIERINFTSDINTACRAADTILLAMPSPYFKGHVDKLTIDISGKYIVSAIKGVVPGENQLVTSYMTEHFGVPAEHCLAIGGPCHAEEVALSRPSYLTVACSDADHAAVFAQRLSGKNTHAITSTDIEGLEYAAILKNIYAIAAGIVHGSQMGDNFLAMVMSNAIREMRRFVDTASLGRRDICDSAYLGDLLVTAYSHFSRNHNLGSLIGRGYSVKAAMMEMEQTAEGYFAAKCIHDLNEQLNVVTPIINCVYDILYRDVKPAIAISRMAQTLD